jgi:hypothetical protein
VAGPVNLHSSARPLSERRLGAGTGIGHFGRRAHFNLLRRGCRSKLKERPFRRTAAIMVGSVMTGEFPTAGRQHAFYVHVQVAKSREGGTDKRPFPTLLPLGQRSPPTITEALLLATFL